MKNNNFPSELFNLKNKNIVITGSAGLLGSQYANTLSAAGANVILIDVDKNGNKKLENSIRKKFQTNPCSYIVDITNYSEIKTTCKDIIKDYGRVDGLINNAAFTTKAGVNKSSKTYALPFENFSLDLWNDSLSINLTGVFLCCKEFGKTMVKHKKGTIVNISSIYGLVGADQRIYGKNKLNLPVSYAATKGAIVNMTRYLAAYWYGKNIRVNTLSLGGVIDERYQDKKFIKNYSEKTILGRMANKTEYNASILFLISDASSYMTGSNLVIDGGWTAW